VNLNIKNNQANRKLSKKSKIYSPLLLLAATAFVIPAPAQALVINASYDETGTGVVSAAAQAVISTAIAFYQNTFSNNITVNIDFHNMISGLGSSLTPIYVKSYTSYKTQLTANASSANDTSAVANLPATVLGGGVILKSADARAVGLPGAGMNLNMTNTSGFCSGSNLDGCIGLNVNLTTTGSGSYSLLATVEHEIDEVLGLGSSMAGNGTFVGGGYKSAEDLFRYSAPGVSSFALNANCSTAPLAYLSINGGVTNLDNFNNCTNGADYGDWQASGQVQSAYGAPGGIASLTVSSPEITALDVIGYTLTPQAKTLLLSQTSAQSPALLVVSKSETAPESASVALFGMGFAGLFIVRRRAQCKKSLRLDCQEVMLI
jgi:hypothetical protein